MLIYMGQIILRLIGALILLAGVILIYDARIITKKFFYKEKNKKFLSKVITLLFPKKKPQY